MLLKVTHTQLLNMNGEADFTKGRHSLPNLEYAIRHFIFDPKIRFRLGLPVMQRFRKFLLKEIAWN